MEMTKNFLAADNGEKLAYIEKHVEDSNLGIVIIHGLAEHKGRYQEFIDRLASAGFSVFAMDLRGHGESQGRRGDIKSFDDYLSDLDVFVKYIKNKYPNLRLALFGHSLGGMIASSYVAENNVIELVVLSSPSFETPKGVYLLRLFPTWLCGKIKIKKRHSESQEMLSCSRSDPLSCHYISIRLLKNSFINGVKFITKRFHKIKIPLLVLGGKHDRFVNTDKLAKAFNKFGSPDKTLKIYENAKHRMVQNQTKDLAIPEIINWLNKHSD